jgi:defect-in-organelle-trafficking protein DotC
MFQFAPLVSPSGTVPPVIEAARDVATFTPDQVRKANEVYKIEREERFVSVPPSWRDYLLVGLPTKPTYAGCRSSASRSSSRVSRRSTGDPTR